MNLLILQFDNSNRNSFLVCFYTERPILYTLCHNRIIILTRKNSFHFKESIRFTKSLFCHFSNHSRFICYSNNRGDCSFPIDLK